MTHLKMLTRYMTYIHKKNVDLQPYNTFKISSIAKDFVVIKSEHDFLELLKSDLYKQARKKVIIWWWSNVLLTQENIDGLVIKNEIFGKERINETDKQISFKVWAGENRDDFVRWSIENGYAGAENLASIPGTVWAAPMQNIGAYWIEIKDLIRSVEWVDLDSWAHVLLASYECKFWYRDSIFKKKLKNKFFITHVNLVLDKYDASRYQSHLQYGAVKANIEARLENKKDEVITPKIVAEEISKIRASKLPDRKKIGTAWSFFKNPLISEDKFKKLTEKFPDLKWYPWEKGLIKLSAGQLIDKAGLKWIEEKTVGTYKKHALIIVNNWWGTGEQISKLALHIQKTVKTKFWIDIIPEVNYI